MAESDDLFVAHAAMQQALLTRDQLREALFQMAADRRANPAHPKPLGTVLVSRGHLSEAQLLAILSARLPPGAESAGEGTELGLGRLLILSGAATTAQITEGLKAQQEETGRPRRLGEILVERGLVTPEQVRRALAYHNKSVYVCAACKIRFNIINAKRTAAYACRKCGGPLNEASRDSVRADESAVMAKVTLPIAAAEAAAPAREVAHLEQALLDRAIAVYLRQKGISTDTIDSGRAQQLDFTRFGVIVSLADILHRGGHLTIEQYREVRKAVGSPDWSQQPLPGYAITGILAQSPTCSLMTVQLVFAEGNACVKMLHADLVSDEAAVARFTAESGLFMRLDHPNLLKGLEFGRTVAAGDSPGDVPYVVLEYMRGETLAHALETRGRQSPAAAMRVGLELAQALRHLHREGLAHGDLRPESILLEPRGHVKICDLTHAKPAAADGPEAKADVYCVGLLLLSMLSGGTLNLAPESAASSLAEAAEAPDLTGLRAPPALLDLLRRFFDPDRAARLSAVGDAIEQLDKMRK